MVNGISENVILENVRFDVWTFPSYCLLTFGQKLSYDLVRYLLDFIRVMCLFGSRGGIHVVVPIGSKKHLTLDTLIRHEIKIHQTT